jgi:hypothetical protein
MRQIPSIASGYHPDMALKWFTPARLWGPDESDPVDEYQRHLQSVRTKLSRGVAELAFQMSLHDARVIEWASSEDSLLLKVLTDDDAGSYEEVTLEYSQPRIEDPAIGSLEDLDLLAGDVEVLYDEIDVEPDGSFVHNVIFWPTGYLAVRFEDLKLGRKQVKAPDFAALVERPIDEHFPRKLYDAWAEFLPPLVRAAVLGNVDEVRYLLADGASPNEADEMGWSALHAAASRSQLEICQILVTAGAATDALDSQGWTPLQNALRDDDGAVVRFLVDSGADLLGGDNGVESLQRAAERNNAATARMLLDAGAEVDATLDDGYTALMTAAESSDDVELVELLLSRGADTRRKTPESDATDTSAKTAAELATRMNHGHVAEAIELWQSRSDSIAAPVVNHEE